MGVGDGLWVYGCVSVFLFKLSLTLPPPTLTWIFAFSLNPALPLGPQRVLRPHHQDAGRVQHHHGWAVQVEPMKPKLKPPGTKRLKLEYAGLLSNFGFKFNLRRYTTGPVTVTSSTNRSPILTAEEEDRWKTGLPFDAVTFFVMIGGMIVITLAGGRRAVVKAIKVMKVGPAGYCSPRHPTHFEPSSLEINGILRRGKQYPLGPPWRCRGG